MKTIAVDIKCRVYQGLILGPLSLLIYINDLQFLNLKILGTLLKASKISPIVGKTAFVFFT